MAIVENKQPCIAIDCRMLGMSGIGVYIENYVPKVLQHLCAYKFRLIGLPALIQQLPLPADCHVTIHPCHAPIYSIQEQLLMPLAARGAQLLWVPHYNIPLLSPTPIMVTVHDMAHLALPEVTKSLLRRAYARLLFEGVRRKAKAILTVSQFTADEFLRYMGKPAGNMRVIPSGLNDTWFEPYPLDPLPLHGEKPPYFIAVGNLKAHKRIDLLCTAFAAVQNTIRHDLILVGKHDGFISGGLSVQELMALAPGRIHCTGTIGTSQLRSLIGGATALVFPSCYEGFGLPPLEAMALQTPVIAADIPPVREVCGDAVTYFAMDNMEDLKEKMLAAASSEAKHDGLGIEKGLARVKQFCCNTSAQSIAEEIRRLLTNTCR